MNLEDKIEPYGFVLKALTTLLFSEMRENMDLKREIIKLTDVSKARQVEIDEKAILDELSVLIKDVDKITKKHLNRIVASRKGKYPDFFLKTLKDTLGRIFEIYLSQAVHVFEDILLSSVHYNKMTGEKPDQEKADRIGEGTEQ